MDRTSFMKQPVNLQSRHFLLPKSGHGVLECEDALGINHELRRYAVADGATEAFDASSWARKLAESWVQSDSPPLSVEEFQNWVAVHGKQLHESWSGLRLSWYAEEKARSGSFAAFAGIQLSAGADGLVWNAIALGDSCLIQQRSGALQLAFPISNYRDFNSAPVLVPSLDTLQRAAVARALVHTGKLEDRDALLLLSDATACWYLMLYETNEPKRREFDCLMDSASDNELALFFEEERRAERIKDDDIAIIRLIPSHQ